MEKHFNTENTAMHVLPLLLMEKHSLTIERDTGFNMRAAQMMESEKSFKFDTPTVQRTSGEHSR